MPAGHVDRNVLASHYQSPGEDYLDTKTEAAFEVVAQQVDDNYDVIAGVASDMAGHKNAAVLDHPDKSVVRVKIADKAIGPVQVDDAAIGQSHHQDNGIPSRALPNNIIEQRHMSDNSVGPAELIAGAVQGQHIANGILSAEKFVEGALTNDTQNGLKIVALKAETANLDGLVWNDTNADNAPVLNAAILTGKRIMLRNGTLTIKSRVNLNAAPHNSYVIEGSGENTILNFVGATAGFYDIYGSQDNENYHIKTMKNLKLQGDGTNIGFEFSSLCLLAENLLFNGFDKGLYVHDGGYSSKFVNCFFRNNKFGIYFGTAPTTIEFDKLYCSVHNNPTGAAIYFNSPNVEDVKIKGIIQANRAPGIWYGTNFTGDVLVDCYFELNGDKDAGTPAIKNDAVAGDILYQNCKIPYNTSGTWKNGDYALGYNVKLTNCRATGKIIPSNSLSLSDCYIGEFGVDIKGTPIVFSGFQKVSGTLGGSGAGALLEIPSDLDILNSELINLNPDPFSVSGVNVAKIVGTNPPTIAQDIVTKYSDKNTTKITWIDSIVGSVSNNSVELRKDAAGVTSVDAGSLTIVTFLIKANKTGNLGIFFGAGTQILTGTLSVSTKWRKFIIFGKNITAGAVNIQHFLYCKDAMTGFETNITGIAVYKNLVYESNAELFNKLLQGKIKY